MRSSILLLFLALPFAASAQLHQHSDTIDTTAQLGDVDFPVSCAPGVQSAFHRGIALLHSFGYSAAISQFREIESRDPQCAMAFWGEAMSLYRQLWDRPSNETLAKGRTLVNKARGIGAKTKREQEYIDAAAAFYDPDSNSDFKARTRAFSSALKRIHQDFPDDDEAASFYALSLLTVSNGGEDDIAMRKQAVAILNPIFARRPNHPGVAHYLIHACDVPAMAREGLPAAKRYAQIAPASAHALHMPSHIFTRLGMWQDDIQSNLASKKAAEEQHLSAERWHAMDFMEYAYLQLGDRDAAKQIETEALSVRQDAFSDRPSYFYYVRVHFPSLYLLEMKQWKEALVLEAPPNAPPGFQAAAFWTNAISAGHLRDAGRAKSALAHFDAAIASMRKGENAYAADDLKPWREESLAWLAFAEGKGAEAVKLITAVADRQDREGKGEVEIPAREMLGDMLLELNRPQEALVAYETSLRIDPNRLNSTEGATRARAALTSAAPSQ